MCRVVRIYSKSARQKDADGDSNLGVKQDSEPQRMRGGYCGQKMNITPELPTEMIDCLLMTECYSKSGRYSNVIGKHISYSDGIRAVAYEKGENSVVQ